MHSRNDLTLEKSVMVRGSCSLYQHYCVCILLDLSALLYVITDRLIVLSSEVLLSIKTHKQVNDGVLIISLFKRL